MSSLTSRVPQAPSLDYTLRAPKLRKPMGRIFFAHSDTEGAITEYTTAHKAAVRVSQEVTRVLARV